MFKKMINLAVFFTITILTACSADSGSITRPIVANILNNECHSQINKQQLWTLAKLQLGAKAQEYEDRVCSCASDEAAQRVTPSQMIALADESKRVEVAAQLIIPTIQACYTKLISK